MLGAAATALLSAFAPFSASAAVTCDQVAAAGGLSVQHAIERLEPGQVACVRGTMHGNVAIRQPDVTLTSEPGQRGRVVGQLKVMPPGDRATVTDLDLDGSGAPRQPSPGVYADDVRFLRNDVTNQNTGICFILGYGVDDVTAERVLIQGNRIHNCGSRAPITNMHHGIYAEQTADLRIVGNEIYDNADRGIQIYPWARRSVITGNVIDGNGVGVIFGGLGGASASENLVRYNVITNSRIRNDVESWYPEDSPPGTGNVVERNCIGTAGISTANGGFVARDNVFADPRFANRAAKDFTPAPDGPCAELLRAGRAGLDWTPPPAPARPSTPVLTKPTQPVQISVSQPAGGGSVMVQLRLDGPAVADTRALVQVKFGKRRWKTMGKPRLKKGGVFRKRLKAPRRAKRVRVRAIVLDGRGSRSSGAPARRASGDRSRGAATRTRRRTFTASKRLV